MVPGTILPTGTTNWYYQLPTGMAIPTLELVPCMVLEYTTWYTYHTSIYGTIMVAYQLYHWYLVS